MDSKKKFVTMALIAILLIASMSVSGCTMLDGSNSLPRDIHDMKDADTWLTTFNSNYTEAIAHNSTIKMDVQFNYKISGLFNGVDLITVYINETPVYLLEDGPGFVINNVKENGTEIYSSNHSKDYRTVIYQNGVKTGAVS